MVCVLKLRGLLSCEDVNHLAQEKLWQNFKVMVIVTAGIV